MSTSHPEAAGYHDIARSLRDRIVRGTWAANGQLPAIGDLARDYRTTAITLRRALRELEDEGLVRVEHGVGSFVTDWARGYDLLPLPSFSSEMAFRDVESSTVVRERSTAIRYAAAAEALACDPDAELAMLGRLRSVNGAPVAYQRSYVPDPLAEVVLTYDPSRSLYEMLRARTGHFPALANERLLALALPADLAGELGVRAGSPGWQSIRTTLDAAAQPLLFDEAWFPAERVELRVRRVANRALLEFSLVNP